MNVPSDDITKNQFLTPQIPSEWADTLTDLVLSKWEKIDEDEISALTINDEVFPIILSLALKYRSYKLTKKCLDFIEKKSNIIILIDHFRRAKFIYHSENESLASIDREVITPIINIFKTYIAVSPESHEISLNLSKEENLECLRTFIENHGFQITAIVIGDERLNDERLFQLKESCKNLKFLDITGFHNVTENGIFALQKLTNLKTLRISNCRAFQSLAFEDMNGLDILELSNVISIENLKLDHIAGLRRLEIAGCLSLIVLT
jgi:hypothetical protein